MNAKKPEKDTYPIDTGTGYQILEPIKPSAAWLDDVKINGIPLRFANTPLKDALDTCLESKRQG